MNDTVISWPRVEQKETRKIVAAFFIVFCGDVNERYFQSNFHFLLFRNLTVA